MDNLDIFYREAQQAAADERDRAAATVDSMALEELKAAYLDMVGMTAYYSRLERSLSATPRLHFDKLRKAMEEIDAKRLIDQVEQAQEEGIPVAGTARVKARPLYEILSRLEAILKT